MFEDTITIIRIRDESYTKEIRRNVNFIHSNSISNEKIGVKNNNSGTVFIPTNKEIELKIGDLIIEGEVKENMSDDKRLSYFQNNYEVYEVNTITKLLNGSLPHYEIGVK